MFASGRATRDVARAESRLGARGRAAARDDLDQRRLCPAAEALFGKFSQPSQRQMLDDTILSVVDLVDDAGWLESTLESYGSRHRYGYEVELRMYDAWAEAVVEGIADALGTSFTDEHARAWRSAIERVHATMIAGANYPKLDAARA